MVGGWLVFQLGKQEKPVERGRQKRAASRRAVIPHWSCEGLLNVLKLNLPIHTKVNDWTRVTHAWPAWAGTESRFPTGQGGVSP